MISKETIDKLIKGDKTYETAEEMSELMNDSFRSVFTLEGTFTEPSIQPQQEGLGNVVVQKQKIYKL